MTAFGLEVWTDIKTRHTAVGQSVAGYDATKQLVVLIKPQHFCLIMRRFWQFYIQEACSFSKYQLLNKIMSFISFIITDHTCLAGLYHCLCDFILTYYHGRHISSPTTSIKDLWRMKCRCTFFSEHISSLCLLPPCYCFILISQQQPTG
jgi:hypothetical protein